LNRSIKSTTGSLTFRPKISSHFSSHLSNKEEAAKVLLRNLHNHLLHLQISSSRDSEELSTSSVHSRASKEMAKRVVAAETGSGSLPMLHRYFMSTNKI
jgi:hypothetical protein